MISESSFYSLEDVANVIIISNDRLSETHYWNSLSEDVQGAILDIIGDVMVEELVEDYLNEGTDRHL